MLLTRPKPPFVSRILPNAVDTGADRESPITHESRQEWEKLINYRLVEWRFNPSQLDEEGTITPSRETIQLAINLANALSKMGQPPPSRIVPDTEGGIVFELKKKNNFESIRISANGEIEHRVFENCRLIYREPWRLSNS